MNAYKKGDWVVIPSYNKYPVQLEEDPRFGGVIRSVLNWRFVEANKKDSEEMGLESVAYYISDSRMAAIYKPESYVSVDEIRMAKKKDFKAILESAKKAVELAQKEIETYTKARDSV